MAESAAVHFHHHHHHYRYVSVPVARPGAPPSTATSHVPAAFLRSPGAPCSISHRPRNLSQPAVLFLPPQPQPRPPKTFDINRIQQTPWKAFLRALYSAPPDETDAQPPSSASRVWEVEQPPSNSACQPDEYFLKEDLSEKKRRMDQPPSDSACQPDEDSFKEDLSEKKRRVDQPPSDSACQPDEDSFKEEEDLSEKKPADNSSDMESDLDFVSAENKEHQWRNLMEKWENEKKRKMTTELAWSEGECREPKDERESESDENEDDEDFHGESHEDLINKTLEVLQRHRGEGSSGHRTHATADGKTELFKVDVDTLRYSQRGCSEHFQCGRPVSQLVDQLLDGRVGLSAPFLVLTVFEARDEDTGEIVLKSADNRRLYALKEYAKKSGRRIMVTVSLFNVNTLRQAKKIIRNTDRTPGLTVEMRTGGNGGKGKRKRNRNRQVPSSTKKRRW